MVDVSAKKHIFVYIWVYNLKDVSANISLLCTYRRRASFKNMKDTSAEIMQIYILLTTAKVMAHISQKLTPISA